jgi:hypothetical protein
LPAGYAEAFGTLFNTATVAFYWRTLEPEQGKPRYTADSPYEYRRPPNDPVVAYMESRGVNMGNGPLQLRLSHNHPVALDPRLGIRPAVRTLGQSKTLQRSAAANCEPGGAARNWTTALWPSNETSSITGPVEEVARLPSGLSPVPLRSSASIRADTAMRFASVRTSSGKPLPSKSMVRTIAVRGVLAAAA